VSGTQRSILALRGCLMQLDATKKTPARKVMPTIHPAFVLRAPRWSHVFRNDIFKAAKWFRGEASWKPPKITYNPSPGALREFLAPKGRLYTYDIETDGIEPLTAHIRCIAVGDTKEVMVVGFRSNKRPRDLDGVFLDFYYGPVAAQVERVLVDFFEDQERVKVAHNGILYDAPCVKKQLNCQTRNIVDTILLYKSVESELPKNLAHVASLYTEAPSWKTDRAGNKIALGGESDEQLHEYCLFEGTPVVLGDGSRRPIQELVRHRYAGDVLSWNAETGQMEPRPVIGWHYSVDPSTQWVRVVLGGQRQRERGLICTADHRVIGPSGEKEAQDLVPGDFVYDSEPALSSDEVCALLGTFMGDSSLVFSPALRGRPQEARSAALSGGHVDESGFAQWKATEVSCLVLGGLQPAKKKVFPSGATHVCKPFRLLRSQNLRQLADLSSLVLDKEGRRRLSSVVLDAMGPRGWAWLYVDDGCKQKISHREPQNNGSRGGRLFRDETVTLCLQGFPREQIEEAAEWVRGRFGACSVPASGTLRLSTVASRNFSLAIAPYLPPEARYKLPRLRDYPSWPPYVPVAKGRGPSLRKVQSVGPFSPPVASRHARYSAQRRYCIDVADNHNFFTPYGLVHNCAWDVACTASLPQQLAAQVALREQVVVWQNDQEMQYVCAAMHEVGMFVDQPARLKKEKELLSRRFKLLAEIRKKTGIAHFNPMSVPQVRALLFDKWQLEGHLDALELKEKDTQTGSGDLSTGDLILRSLLTLKTIPAAQREIIKLIRHYRKALKVLGTYVVKMRPSDMEADLGWDDDDDWIDKETRKTYGEVKRGIVSPYTGRMHPGYSISIPVTGRLSSFKPMNCFDGETEILTHEGWVRFDMLQKGVPVAQWNDDGTIEFVLPTAYQRGPYRGEMVRFQHQSADLFMTPDHRLPLLKTSGRSSTKRAEELIELGAGYHTRHAGLFVGGEGLPLSDDEIRLIVALHADASEAACGGKTYGFDVTLCKKRKIKRFERLLTALGIQHRKAAHPIPRGGTLPRVRFYLPASPRLDQLKTYIAPEGGWVERRWGPWLLQMSSHQMDIFKDELWHWDACAAAKNQYANKLEVNADWAQTLLCLRGVRANKNLYTNKEGNSVWLVNVRRTETNAITHRAVRESVPWEGEVYCVTVPSDAIVVRRRGKVTITRQSMNYPKPLRALVTAAPGNVLVGADMDQIELRIASALWQVKLYLLAFADGKDPHSMTAFAIFGAEFCKAAGVPAAAFTSPGKLVGTAYDAQGKFIGTGDDKKMRDLSKAVMYASQYMATVETVHKLIQKTEFPAIDPTTGKPRTDGTTDLPYALLPLKRVREMRENWLKGAPEYEKGWEKEINEFRELGYLCEPVGGRRRDFLDGENPNELVNFKVQCLPGHIRVLTSEGYIPISQLEGRSFSAWTGLRWAPATCIAKDVVPLRKVRTTHALSLVCDETHALKVPDRSEYAWKEVADLIGNQRVCLDLARPLEFGAALDTEDAYVMGLWIADGFASWRNGGRERAVQVGWAVGDVCSSGPKGRAGAPQIERLRAWAEGRGLIASVSRGVGCSKVAIYSGGREWCEEWGLNPGWTARSKRVPERIWRSNLEARKAFLCGVLDGDGYQDPVGAVSLHLCNPDLLEELALLFRTVGVDALSLQGPLKPSKDRDFVSYRLRLAAAHTHTHLQWGRPAKYRSNNTLPQFECRRVLSRLDPKTASHRTIRSRIKGHAGARSTSPYTVQEMGVEDVYDHAVVTSVGDLRLKSRVYTLCVDDPDHQYVAGGFICKNSAAAALMNKALIQLFKAIPLHAWGPGTGIINQCHDSIVIECPADGAYWDKEAKDGKGAMVVPTGSIPDRVGRFMEQCMAQTHPALPGVTFTASADVGLNWAKVG